MAALPVSVYKWPSDPNGYRLSTTRPSQSKYGVEKIQINEFKHLSKRREVEVTKIANPSSPFFCFHSAKHQCHISHSGSLLQYQWTKCLTNWDCNLTKHTVVLRTPCSCRTIVWCCIKHALPNGLIVASRFIWGRTKQTSIGRMNKQWSGCNLN